MKRTKDLNFYQIEQWWSETDFKQMERITGFRQYNFDTDEGYQSFADTCDSYWKQLSMEEKISAWEENHSFTLN
ncbi:MAG: hypothetical protein LBG28_07700 [Tannerella sp.]|jgi:hypothetical protein|nr:hypothetical protein [Tannerella sp.]